MCAMAGAQLCVLLYLGASLCSGFTYGRFRRRPSEFPVTVQDHWFQQKLDHFNGADTRVWNQRYYVNDSFTKDNGPIFLMIGGEGTANPAWMTQGTWITYAEKLRALCFLLEHRFYGKSHPTENMSVDNLRYLSSQQALADLAHFQVVMTEKLGLGNRKWIVFGGSYPGCLAAWYRLKFPHLAHAAVASSAPVQAVLNFSEYLDVVQSSLARNHSGCPKMMKVASDTLIELLLYKENYEKITRDFNLCKPLEINSKMDLAFLLDTIAEYIMDIVQYNNDNREFEGVKNTNITIQVVCDIMANESWGSPYDRYVEVLHTIIKATQEKCIEASYQTYVQDMRDCRWEGAASTGGRQWMYQTCTEFGYFQSSDSTSQPFSGFPLSYHIQQCADIYCSEFNSSVVTAGIQQTNENYGGLNIQSSRTIFPNGLIDPWHALGINRSLSSDVVAIPMQDAAHCADMYPARIQEPPILPAVRKHIYELLTKWLQ
ncbi:PREDICTED: putative serine protease K12H4.7 [Nanorana parkeri]|uniref:putative serine protease K12H4.7 n=1 Tax=Nanorana parkeri TaxID=125878 RepID=UPI00085498D8|nr:PREDICTED: putative serine protease K12H4.7 [Nanorana parkeri]